MRAFELDETFVLVVIPGYAFQNMLTSEDQVACLECIKRHLNSNGMLVLHLDYQNISWLGDLRGENGGLFGAAESVPTSEDGPPGSYVTGVVL